jgi:N4-gp56 family major capsid protein
MAASTTTSLDDLFTNIVAEARFTASEQSLLRNLVNGFDVSDQEGLTVQVPKYISVAASGLTEGTDLTSTQVTTSNVSMTVAESGVQAVLTDLAAKSTTGDTAGDMGFILGDGVATKIDTDVIGLFTSFTTNALGAAGQEITPADIFKASAILRNKKVRGQKVCVLHPFQAFQLKSSLTNAFVNPNSGDVQNEAMGTGYVGQLGDVLIYESANIVPDGSDDAIGCVFVPSAMGVAVKWDVTIEPERDASLRAWELNATAAYAVGILDQNYAVKMTFDAAL